MNDDVLVRVDNVSKRFCRSLKKSLWYGLQDLGSELGGHRHGGGSGLPQSSADIQLREDEFWAVKDVSFELRRGECLGLIGRNGAGKTTLLRMLNGLIKPDTGSIRMTGRVSALIALGAGFNPVLTGRENIYVNASILGLDKTRIQADIGEIIEFADLSDFIDSPVQAYSSGMQVRLGFAIASQWLSSIILLDEVLAVGDIAFRNKCYNRLASIRKRGRSFILVSHDMYAIARVCNQCILMSKGHILYQGNAIEAIGQYEADTGSAERLPSRNDAVKSDKILHIKITSNGKDVEHWKLGKPGEIVISLAGIIDKSLELTYVFSGISTSGQQVHCRGSCPLKYNINNFNNQTTCIASADSIILPPGKYSLKIGIWKTDFDQVAAAECFPITISSDGISMSDSSHYQEFTPA